MKIDIIVVIYNKLVKDIPVIQLYENKDEIDYLVCDNSTDENIKQKNKTDAQAYNNLIYIDMKGNKGLSRAYNSAIYRCAGDLICIFDDDTLPESDYIEKIKVQCTAEGVYLPLVKSGTRLLSPLNIIGPVIYRCKNTKGLNLKTCSAFNSGMVISKTIVKAIAYDERLFLDFVDHAFCREAHRRGIPFYLLKDVTMQQNYSKETNNLQAALKRSLISSKDITEYYSGNLLDWIYGRLYLAYRLVANTLRYRSFAFLRQSIEPTYRG